MVAVVGKLVVIVPLLTKQNFTMGAFRALCRFTDKLLIFLNTPNPNSRAIPLDLCPLLYHFLDETG